MSAPKGKVTNVSGVHALAKVLSRSRIRQDFGGVRGGRTGCSLHGYEVFRVVARPTGVPGEKAACAYVRWRIDDQDAVQREPEVGQESRLPHDVEGALRVRPLSDGLLDVGAENRFQDGVGGRVMCKQRPQGTTPQSTVGGHRIGDGSRERACGRVGRVLMHGPRDEINV
jgi:hypothetical protein